MLPLKQKLHEKNLSEQMSQEKSSSLKRDSADTVYFLKNLHTNTKMHHVIVTLKVNYFCLVAFPNQGHSVRARFNYCLTVLLRRAHERFSDAYEIL